MEKLLKYCPNLVMGVVVLSLIAFVGFCLFFGLEPIRGW